MGTPVKTTMDRFLEAIGTERVCEMNVKRVVDLVGTMMGPATLDRHIDKIEKFYTSYMGYEASKDGLKKIYSEMLTEEEIEQFVREYDNSPMMRKVLSAEFIRDADSRVTNALRENEDERQKKFEELIQEIIKEETSIRPTGMSDPAES